MEICSMESRMSMEIALKEAGFAVEKTVKRGKKTVITVIRKTPQGGGQQGEKRVGKEKG